ncbi:hypothetical protein C8R45DRAFT_943250 [Mycena sanguinolenta]|nr:hypothetical protein C8R45DRAFT_943250 [Mycena sanguinolenta]
MRPSEPGGMGFALAIRINQRDRHVVNVLHAGACVVRSGARAEFRDEGEGLRNVDRLPGAPPQEHASCARAAFPLVLTSAMPARAPDELNDVRVLRAARRRFDVLTLRFPDGRLTCRLAASCGADVVLTVHAARRRPRRFVCRSPWWGVFAFVRVRVRELELERDRADLLAWVALVSQLARVARDFLLDVALQMRLSGFRPCPTSTLCAVVAYGCGRWRDEYAKKRTRAASNTIGDEKRIVWRRTQRVRWGRGDRPRLAVVRRGGAACVRRVEDASEGGGRGRDCARQRRGRAEEAAEVGRGPACLRSRGRASLLAASGLWTPPSITSDV